MQTYNFHDFCEKLQGKYTRSECRVLWNAYLSYAENFAKLEGEISQKTYAEELATGKPYQQILGMADFFGLTFFVNEHTLIPRPETEELLEHCIARLKENFPSEKSFKILEIGAGSGIISIVLKKYFPNAEVWSMDISPEALKVAGRNAQKHGVDIQFFQADYLAWREEQRFDVIISNPPYIGREEMKTIAPTVLDYEPHLALFPPTDDALLFYRKIADDARKILTKNGFIFLEINQLYGKETLELFQHFSERELLKDLSGNDRMCILSKLSIG